MEINKKISIQRRWALAWFREWIRTESLDSIFIQDKKDDYHYYFKGVTRQLEIWIRWNDITVAAIHRKGCWDMLRCIDLYATKNKKGYYCYACDEKPVRYYSSLRELYIQHNCNELLHWTREIIIPGNILYLMALPDHGATWAKVTTEDKLTDDRDCIFRAIPLFDKGR